MRQPTRFELVALALAFFALGTGVGVYGQPVLSGQALPQDIREFNASYHFISPLLACSQDQDIKNGEVKSLESDLNALVARHRDAGDIDDAAIYFRDLNGGPWVGVNYDKQYPPASLLKVPLAMSVYEDAETDPALLTEKVMYSGTEAEDDQYFKTKKLEPGEYTVDQLVHQMLINSDNAAANILAHKIGEQEFKHTYADLGIDEPSASDAGYTSSAHEFGSFFRILYNATYLTRESSEHVLGLLTETPFKAGLVAGVPSGIVVAHKFGERSFEDTLTVQLHDCGIVYVPEHPYLLCVMSEGTNFDKLAATIADISKTVYNYVN